MNFSGISILAASLLLTACLGSGSNTFENGRTQASQGGALDSGATLDTSRFKAAAAKRNIDPTPAQIKGVMTSDTPVIGKLQQFNLGGYGGFAFNGPQDLANFDIGGPPATGLGDGTFLRVFVLESQEATPTRLVLVTMDAIGAGNVIQNKLKEAVAKAAKVPQNNVLFAQTHSHSSADLQGLWGGVPASWLNCEKPDASQACNPALKGGLYQLAAEAAAEAVANLQPAYLDFAQTVLEGEARLNNFRRCNPDDSRSPDPTLTVLQARAADGRVLGSVLNYSAHPTVLGASNRLVHTDWVGGALRTLERNFDSTVLFFNGAIADSSPRAPASEDPYEQANAMGVAVAQASMNALNNRKKLEGGLKANHVNAFLPVTNPLFVAAGGVRSFNGYYNFTPLGAELASTVPGYEKLPQSALYAETPVSRIQLGEGTGKILELVSIPGEASRGMADSIRARSKNPMMLLGLTHNSLGYILTEDEFGNGLFECQSFYEETVSLGPLTTPALNLQAYDPLFATD